MENKIQDVLITYINKFGGFVEKAIDTAMEEVPKIIKEYLDWSFWEAVISLSFSIVILIALAFLFKFFLERANKVIKENKGLGYYDRSEAYIGYYSAAVVSQIFIAIVFFSAFDEIKTIVKIQIAPRIFLIEKATEYVYLKSYCSEPSAKSNHPFKCSNF